MKKSLFSIILFFTTLYCAGQAKPSIRYGNNPSAGAYVNINGIRMYYETYGSGRPLLFLHGNGGSIRSAAAKIEYFKDYFKVIAIDSRAHGKSLDSLTKDLTYDQMAEDIKLLMDSLNIDSAYVSGQSDGGILGLLLAIKYPRKIAKLATFGANLFPGRKAIFDEVDKMVKDTLKTTKDFHKRRLYSLLEYHPNITEAQLKKIKAQVLVMSGDRDVIRLEHSLKIFYNIENSNFFVMPGASHFGSSQKPELFNMVLLDFLTKPFYKLSTYELMTGKK